MQWRSEVCSWETFHSRVEKQWRQEIETESSNDQDRRHHEHDPDQPVRQRAGTGFALDADAFRGAMDEPIAGSEKRDRRREEVRLIGRKPGEVADPSAADPETEQKHWQDAARRCRERAQKTAGSH